MISVMRDWSWADVTDAERHGLGVIGRGVRRWRLARRLSQQQLAWRTGVGQSTISRLENARMRSLRIGTLARIIGVLEVSADFIFPGEPAPSGRRLPGMHC
jgi:transcriptional regulator with XRE-family HTH domain